MMNLDGIENSKTAISMPVHWKVAVARFIGNELLVVVAGIEYSRHRRGNSTNGPGLFEPNARLGLSCLRVKFHAIRRGSTSLRVGIGSAVTVSF
ncbi:MULTISPECIES: hypothetical protein [Methylomonas]|uniref:hypothetical protein n=1 Tax=Methylomonas TaxID=416 RepID=UPI001232AB74|nr:hypothetical protein [Methylomonas rhizoryzae]